MDEMKKEDKPAKEKKVMPMMKADPKDVEENKLIAAIGYIGILCFIPLLAKKDSAFAQFHGKQGLAIFIVEVLIAVVGWIPIIGWIISFVGFIVCAVAAIYGLVTALQGQMKPLPGFSAIAQKINL